MKFIASDNYFLFHKEIKIDCKCIEEIYNSKILSNKDNFHKKDGEWYVNNKHLCSIIYPEEIFKSVKYINNDMNDLRLSNLFFEAKYEKELNNEDYKIIKYGDPYYIKQGKFSGQYRNMYWKVKNRKTKEKYYLMRCKNVDGIDEYFKFSLDSLDKVLKIGNNRNVWYIGANGYISSTFKDSEGRKIRYLHQHLLDYYGNGLGKNINTIDHINRNKLDNRLENLRIISQSEQNKNVDKRNRKYNAKELPDGITQDMLPKFVVYYNECYNKEKKLYREFFKIEKHPKIKKPICSSKSVKISIVDKLNEIKGYIEKLNNGEMNVKETKKYPAGISLKNNKFILDLRRDGMRYNLTYKLSNEKTEEINYKIFIDKINKKYNELNL